jgi:ferric-dicitrate binding protein FerR (iron transport regulator)
MKVVVTGTKFNLKSYPEEAIVETTLEEGQVTISNARSEKLAMLKPGQQARYDLKGQEIKVNNVTPEIYSLWKNNELRFSNISFEELVPRIERWYGITIKLDTKIGKKDRFTMTIKTESLRELLNMLQLTSKFKYEINGSSVKISSI